MSQATLVIQETPLDTIRLLPRNLRRQVCDVADLAQSMKERGVLGGLRALAYDPASIPDFASF